MDNLTEEVVMDEAIAHRFNSIKGFDRIIIFHEGKIVEQGTFAELMESNSYFTDLYNASVC